MVDKYFPRIWAHTSLCCSTTLVWLEISVFVGMVSASEMESAVLARRRYFSLTRCKWQQFGLGQTITCCRINATKWGFARRIQSERGSTCSKSPSRAQLINWTLAQSAHPFLWRAHTGARMKVMLRATPSSEAISFEVQRTT